MEFHLSYSKSWKLMLWKCCTQYASKYGKLSSGHMTGKGQFSFQSQRKAMSKNAQTTAQLHSSQFSSVTQLCPTFGDPMDCSIPGLPVHYQLLEFTQIHVHWVGDAIQPSHPLSSPSPPALNLSQHQSLFQWVSSSHQVAKLLEFQLQHQSFQWTPQGWTPLQWTGWISSQSKWLSRVFSNTTVQKHQFFSAQLSFFFFYSPTLTSIHDHWKNHSLH